MTKEKLLVLAESFTGFGYGALLASQLPQWALIIGLLSVSIGFVLYLIEKLRKS